jgi:ABC-2 type transport system ATP-binding protein
VSSATVAEPAVVVDDLVVRYGALTAVNHASWTADAGEIVAVLGPNGAGKSTTIETLEGYRSPHEGRVRVLGLDPIADARALAPRVYLTMGPREVIRLFAAYYGPRALDPDELLERVGLGRVATTPWRRLSGGEQQRTSLALALVGRPEVAFLDEPTAMVDPGARQVLRELVAGLRHDGVCVVLTTHDMDDAERLADRVVIVDHGAVVAVGTPAELTTATGDDGIVFDTTTPFDAVGLAAQLGGPVTSTSPGVYRVQVGATPANLSALTSWLAANDVAVGGIRAGRRSLEEVFLRLTSERNAGPADDRAEAAASRRSRRRAR